MGPLSNQCLQGNYEDHVVHHICMGSAQRACVRVWLLQTNADLDLSRGIIRSYVNTNFFCGRLQSDACGQQIGFGEESVDEIHRKVQKVPDTLIDLATAIGSAKNK